MADCIEKMLETAGAAVDDARTGARVALRLLGVQDRLAEHRIPTHAGCRFDQFQRLDTKEGG